MYYECVMTSCGDVLFMDFYTFCPEGYDYPASESACSSIADDYGYSTYGTEGPYGSGHPPCFWNSGEMAWVHGYSSSECPDMSGDWNDLGAVCVRVGGPYDTMGCTDSSTGACSSTGESSISSGVSCDTISSHYDVSQTCSSSGTSFADSDVCIVVVENSAFSTCREFCADAGSTCVDGSDSHGGSCDNVDQTDDAWGQGCDAENCGDDCICMCSSTPSCTMVSEPNYYCNDYFSFFSGSVEEVPTVDECVTVAGAAEVCPTNYISFAARGDGETSWCDCCADGWTPASNDYGYEETGGTYFCSYNDNDGETQCNDDSYTALSSDCGGNDMEWLENHSVEMCETACDESSRCAGFTYTYGDVDGRVGEYGCCLKSSSCSAAVGSCDASTTWCFYEKGCGSSDTSGEGYCDDSMCSSWGDDCCAPDGEEASCYGGYSPVRFTGSEAYCWGYDNGLYTCCTGDYDVSDGYCSQAWCTSPNGDGGYDCWAGSDSEECSCSEGKAKETGERSEYDGTTYYEYTCCTDGSGHGEECGDCCTDVGLIILIVVLSVVGFVMCATCGGVAICYFAKCACFAPGPQQQQPGMQMVQMGQPQQGVIIQPQQHQGVIMGQPQQQQGVIMGQPQQGVIVQAAPTKTSTL